MKTKLAQLFFKENNYKFKTMFVLFKNENLDRYLLYYGDL